MHEIPANFATTAFPETPEGVLAREGQDLITRTNELIGPKSLKPFAGNNLTCANCHLGAGTKPFAAPFIGLSGVYPQYLGRDNKIASIEDRVNSCVERSLNGKAMDVSSREMRAIVTYIKFLSRGTVVGERTIGQGFIKYDPPRRAADKVIGAKIFSKNCAMCHGTDGQGKRSDNTSHINYLFPPLWGPDSYNDGAGMHRILTAARFIKANMPLGVTATNPLLTDEEAYDVAAFINSQPRPEKKGKEKDYPVLANKPKDCPYPPFGDNVSQAQHQFGPFNF
jgi:thiosulfate dehydrogenase